MTSPIKKAVAGRKPGKPSESLIKDQEAKARRQDAEGFIKSKSEGGKKAAKKILETMANRTSDQKAAAAAKQKKPNLKPSQEAEMEAFWESGEFTLNELAERYGRDPTSISRHMSLKGIIKGSRAEEYSRIVREKVAEELSGPPSETARQIKQMKEDNLKYTSAIAKLTWAEMAKAQQQGLPFLSIRPNLMALKEAASIFSMLRVENWALLGVVEFEQRNDVGEIPELLISELTNEDVEKMRMDQQRLNRMTKGLSEVDVDAIDESEVSEPAEDEVVVEGE